MKRTIVSSVLTGTLALSAAACNTVEQDDFRSEKGISPDPSGVIKGSVVYAGPHPRCEYKDGKAVDILGRVILTLFDFDNPPAPEGRASSSKNLLVLKGSELFSLDDCLPEGEEPNYADRITRAGEFLWPSIQLFKNKPSVFQIRGFFDADGDMLPFFSVRRIPTAGDIAGGALVDPSVPAKGNMPLHMAAQKDATKGVLLENVTVTLGSPVMTERPMFQLSENRYLNAESAVKAVVDGFRANVPATVERVWNLTCADQAENPDDVDPSCGLKVKLVDQEEVQATIDYAGVGIDFSPERYGFFFENVDVKTVVKGGPDINLPDGVQDPHPIFGSSLGLDWMTPMVLAQRSALIRTTDEQGRTEAFFEAQAGIPSVTLVGTVLPSDVPGVLPAGTEPAGSIEPRSRVEDLRVALPPIGVVDLDPIDTACRVLYVPPGNVYSSYDLRVAECKELPTGTYGVNVLQGIAGGTVREEADPDVSASGLVIDGGRYSGQSWSIPNELGDPGQVGSHALASQGRSELLVVYDGDTEPREACTQGIDPVATALAGSPVLVDLKLRTKCQEDESPFGEDELPGSSVITRGSDGNYCMPAYCCNNVAHLCDVPLCPYTQQDGRAVRESPTRLVGTGENGKPIPNCLPFPMPDLCCAPET